MNGKLGRVVLIKLEQSCYLIYLISLAIMT